MIGQLEPLLTTADVALIARVDKRTVQRWIREGQLEAVKGGHRLLVSRECLDAFLRPAGQGGER